MPIIIGYRHNVWTCHSVHKPQEIQAETVFETINTNSCIWLILAKGMLIHFHTSYPTIFNGWRFQIRVLCSTVVLVCDTDSYWILIQAMLCFNVITLCYNRPAIVYINHGRTKILASYSKKCLSLCKQYHWMWKKSDLCISFSPRSGII